MVLLNRHFMVTDRYFLFFFSLNTALINYLFHILPQSAFPFFVSLLHPFTARPEKNIIRSQCMGNSQYRRQHHITYHGYKYSLPSVAGFIRQSVDYYLFLPPEISGGQSSERVKSVIFYSYQLCNLMPVVYLCFETTRCNVRT